MLERLFALLLKLVLFAAALVTVAVVLCLLGVFLALWMLRSAWARLTGKPATPWTVRFGPRSAWQSVQAFGARVPRDAPLQDRLEARRDGGDVVDAQVKRQPD